MTTTSIRRLLMSLILASGTWFGSAGVAAATAPTSTTTPTTATTSAVTPTTSASVTIERPPNPDDGFQIDDVREFIEDNTIPIVVVVGLILVVALWRFISRPSKLKF